MRVIFGILFAVVSFGFAQAADLMRKAPPPVVNCGSLCDAYKHARSTGPVSYSGDLVCVHFEQPAADKVVIRFYDRAGHELDAGDALHARLAKKGDTFCVGRQWFEKARGGHVELCNTDAHSTLGPEVIEAYLRQGGTQPGHYVCLYGEKGCKAIATALRRG